MKTLKVVIVVGMVAGMLTLNPALANAQGSAKRVKVAILDSGSNIAFEEGVSLIDATVKDLNGHGSLMARIVKEAYPQAELYIIKVMGTDGLLVDEEAIILGIEWAVSREVDVINMSLRTNDSQRLREAVQKAFRKGIVLVAAAGNKSTRMNRVLTQDTNLLNNKGIQNSAFTVATPARYAEVVAVGALDRNAKAYDASIAGEEVEVYCKGYKDGRAGTSIASAYASGHIARIISENPNADTHQIRSIMIEETQGR